MFQETALLVVDMQNAFVAAGNPTRSGCTAHHPNINHLARAVRTHGGLVVWLGWRACPETGARSMTHFYRCASQRPGSIDTWQCRPSIA